MRVRERETERQKERERGRERERERERSFAKASPFCPTVRLTLVGARTHAAGG